MQAIIDTIRVVDNIPTILAGAIRSVIEENAGILREMIETQMYERGVNADGSPIHRIGMPDDYVYSMKTVAYKRKRGQRYDHVTLRDTGNYHRSIRLVTDDEGFSFVADDWKSERIAAYYTDNHLQLTDDSKSELMRQKKENMVDDFVNSFKNARV